MQKTLADLSLNLKSRLCIGLLGPVLSRNSFDYQRPLSKKKISGSQVACRYFQTAARKSGIRRLPALESNVVIQ